MTPFYSKDLLSRRWLLYYWPPTKLEEGGVFSLVFLCTVEVSVQDPSPLPWRTPILTSFPLQVPGSAPLPHPRHSQICVTWISLHKDLPPSPLPDIFKLVHCVTRTVDRRVGNILLKCLLVWHRCLHVSLPGRRMVIRDEGIYGWEGSIPRKLHQTDIKPR